MRSLTKQQEARTMRERPKSEQIKKFKELDDVNKWFAEEGDYMHIIQRDVCMAGDAGDIEVRYFIWYRPK